MTSQITYTAVTAWGASGWTETGDLDAHYVNSYGADMHGYIWLGHDGVTIGVTGISSVTRPFGQRATADAAINTPAYRAKVIASAKNELATQFEATNNAPSLSSLRDTAIA